MLDGHKTEAESRKFADTARLLGELDWRTFALNFDPPLDPRIAFAAWNRTVQCWLALASVCHRGNSLFRPEHGWLRKTDKVPPTLLHRFFTFKELTDIYFLILLDLCSAAGMDRIDRLASFLEALNAASLNTSLRKVVDPLYKKFSASSPTGHETVQKRLDRGRTFLLEQGFSHIRIDLLTGRVRLCPIPKDIEPAASLKFNQQPGNEVTNEATHLRWEARFGKSEFLEIALDSRVNDFHKLELQEQNKLTIDRQVNPFAPNHGIIRMPNLAEILISVGVIN